MLSITRLFFLVAIVAAIASASPTLHKRGVYKVERVANPNFTGRNGPRALLKTLRKYRMPIPAALTGAAVQQNEMISKRHANVRRQATNGTIAATNGTGLVTATPEPNDAEYLSPVNIGGQTVTLDFDSGSSDLWVFSTQLSPQAATGHQTFDPATSQSFKAIDGASFQISYGDGSGAAGNVGTDVVNIGGAEVQTQAVELAQAVSRSFVEDTNTDGLLGLAFSSINTVQPAPQKTFFDNVMPSLAEPVFTADLRPQAVGAYEFGAIDQSKFTGQMTWVPVNTTQGFWQFTSQQFAVNGGAVQPATPNNQAIADTGTTLILADPLIVQGYYSQVPGAVNDAQVGGVIFPCDTQMPDLQLDVGGTMATVKGDNIKFAPLNATTCFGGMQASPVDFQIYGDIFFKSNFVAFNGGNNSIGYATHV